MPIYSTTRVGLGVERFWVRVRATGVTDDSDRVRDRLNVMGQE